MSPATTQAVQVGSLPMVGGSSTTPVAQIFQGYDTFTGNARSTAVVGQSVVLAAQAGAKCDVYMGSAALCQALGISASAQANFGFGSVDAKASFVRSLNLTATSVCILVHSYVKRTRTMTFAELRDKESASDPRRFFQAYGDSYVSSLTTGAEYIAVYSFYTQTTTEQAELAASIRAKIPDAGNLNGSVQAQVKKASSSTDVRWTMRQNIIGVEGLKYPSADDIVDFALEFPEKADEANDIIGYTTAGYEHVTNMPDFGQVPASRALIQHDDGSPGTVTLQLAALQGVANQIAWLNDSAAGIYQAYGYAGDTVLQERAKQNSAEIAALQDFAYGLAMDPTQSTTPPQAPSLGHGTPVLAFTSRTEPMFSIPGGESFQDFTPDMIVDKVKLTSLALVADEGVVGLKAGYALPDGNKVITRGESDGADGDTLTLQPGEFITRISGAHTAEGIKQIKFDTNQKHWLWYPGSFAPRLPETFHWSAAPGHVLVGFQGRGGSTLNSLKPVTVEQRPATWAPLPANLQR